MKKNRTIHLPGPALLLLLFVGLLLPAILGCNAVNSAVATLTAPTVTATPDATATPLPQVIAVPASSPSTDNSAVAPAEADLVALIDAAGLDFAERRTIAVYDRVAPSVVNITTQVLVRNFFGVAPEEGSGSGFVLDAEGHILTNYHVIEGAQQIEVSFSDATVLAAEVVGTDPRNDLAVLRVDAPDGLLRPVELGTSAGLKAGQWAIAIGNPFGQFDRTLTTGVISALNRTLEGSDGRTITGVIQTDAAINRGNSGGPLLDSSGRVIGINTAIYSPSGSSSGVGFAVPVDTVRRVLPDLLSLGYYRHPWLGLQSGYSISPGLADALQLPVAQGVLIVQLAEAGPLAQAGVRGAQSQVVLGNQRAFVGGDILLAINGEAVTAVDSLDSWLEDGYRVGDTVTVSIQRADTRQELQIQLGEEPR